MLIRPLRALCSKAAALAAANSFNEIVSKLPPDRR
jgi:hypothetical protein